MTSPEMVFGHVTPADWEDSGGARSHAQAARRISAEAQCEAEDDEISDSLPEPPELPHEALMQDSDVARFRLPSNMIAAFRRAALREAAQGRIGLFPF